MKENFKGILSDPKEVKKVFEKLEPKPETLYEPLDEEADKVDQMSEAIMTNLVGS